MDQRRCPRCRAQVLTGQTATPRCALPAILDPTPLDVAGELAALTDGRLTWTLHHGGQLYLRSADTIRARPAGQVPRQAVHADHACEGEGNR